LLEFVAMSSRSLIVRLSVTLFALLFLGATTSSLPTTTVAAPDAQSASPPIFLDSEPASGAFWAGGPVVFIFDQPLGDPSASAVTVEPPLAGEVIVEGERLTFTPGADLTPGVRYQFSIETALTSAEDVALRAPVIVTLIGQSPLQVTSTQPADGAIDVSTASQIIVVFNRPVVPLTGVPSTGVPSTGVPSTGVDGQDDLPQPLTIDPPVEGEGVWLNTSIFAFQPTLGLAGATEYEVTVANLTGLAGETLAEPVTFRFTTATPLVLDVLPQGDQAPPTEPVVVTFSQPMDPASTEAAFSLTHTNGEQGAVAGTFGWDEVGATLTFSPTSPLEFGGAYRVRIAASAQPASRQGALREAFEREFRVVPLPAVEVVSPLDGATNVSPDTNVTIRFNAPMSYTAVLPNIGVTPTLTTTQIYSYYADYNSEATLSWFKQPNTTYTVTVGGEIPDNYGNTLGEKYVFSFTTGDYTPFTRINLDRFTHFSAITETRVSVYYRNVESIDAALYRLPTGEFLKLTGNNQWEVWQDYQIPDRAASRIWARSYEPHAGRNVTGQQIITLTTEAGEILAPGFYLLEVNQPQTDPPIDPYTNPAQVLIVLSDYNLTLKKSQAGASIAWLTDLRTGEPVAGQPINFYLEQSRLAQASTDEEGIATTELTLSQENSYWPVRALAGEPGDPFFAAVSSEWNTGVAVWDFGLSGGYTTEAYQTHFYTDRPIYRPGQTVYWKGIVRVLTEDGYALPPAGQPVGVIVRDDQGNAVVETEYELNENGTVHGQIELAATAVTGFYYLETRIEVAGRTVYGGAGFQVASYRRPEFEVSVTPVQPEFTQGDTVRVDVQANYFSGGALGNAPVEWRLIAEPYFFNWEQGPTDRFYTFTPYDPDQETDDPYRYPFFGLIQEGRGRTAADGSFVIEAPAAIQESLHSQRWAFDVTVQSPTNQFVSGRMTVPVHKGEFYIGLSPQRYVVNVGNESTVDVVTVTPQGDRYAGAELAVTVYEYEWNSVYTRAADGAYHWQTSVLRTPVLTTTTTTNRQGEAVISWIPDQAGQFQMVARGEDDAGNSISSATYLYVSDPNQGGFVAWPRENNDRIKLVADKQLYEPGETARILVPSPFSGPVQALVTLEQAGVVEARVITFAGNSETLEIPVTAEQIPNVFVGVILVKGVDETNPLPAMRVGYAQLNIDTGQKELTIEVEASATEVAPRETVTYTLTVTDNRGEPVAGAEVSLALVDKAVLSLATGDTRSLLDIFYYQRPLGVTTGVLLAINKDRLSQQLSEGAKGGGGGPGNGLEIREDFPDVAYWNAALTTDANGQIIVAIPLPDNLTTWSLTARAITTDTLVGQTTYETVVTKELQVRPLLPRFFTAGDRARIGAVVLNTTAEAASDLRFTIETSGATLQTEQTVLTTTVAANGQRRFDFPITVDAAAPVVVVTMTAQSALLSDAIRLEIPVARYETPEVVGTSGAVPPEGVVEAIVVPGEATDQGELVVQLEPSLAAGMLDGLTYLEHFPYECNEQTVSRFLPNLLTVRALRALDIENAELENRLAYQLGIGVQQLMSRQNADGGWGYWPGEESSPFISAYVLWGLHSADSMGYTVANRTLTNAVSYLERQFEAPKDVESNWQLNEMAFMNFVLSERGAGDPGRASTLYEVRERLSYYGQALLAMTLANLAGGESDADPRINTLLDNLYGAARISATGASWHEAETDFATLNTDTRTTSMVLAAFVRLDPQQPFLSQVVRWLMSARQAGHWSTTQENAWAIIALTDWLATTGELEGDYDWSVQLNGDPLGQGEVTPETVSEQVTLRTAISDLLRDEANRLLIERHNRQPNGRGELYYTTHLRYYLDALAIQPRDRGIVLDRRFELDGAPVSAAQVGEVISVTVTIIAPTDLYHALIEVPIPAGVEPIDPSLATTSNVFGAPELMPVDEATNAWGFWTPTYTDIRDDKVALFATRLPAGAYEYTFQVRATLPGEYRVLPVYGEMMYFNEVWGRSSGSLFTVGE
jgi:alpha-2-macroglobulin